MLSKGFTKIELLIIGGLIFIVLIIDLFVVIYFNNKIHDIRVLSDVNQIRSGLELYLQTFNYYPEVREPVALRSSYAETEKLCLAGFKNLGVQCEKNILNPVPKFYLNGDDYLYLSTDDNKNYKIEFILKTNFRQQGLTKGLNCADNFSLESKACF